MKHYTIRQVDLHGGHAWAVYCHGVKVGASFECEYAAREYVGKLVDVDLVACKQLFLTPHLRGDGEGGYILTYTP